MAADLPRWEQMLNSGWGSENFMPPKAMTKIAVFKGRQVRRVLIKGEWWFSVVDVVAILTDSDNPRDYWYKMKIREKDDAGIELSTICRQLK